MRLSKISYALGVIALLLPLSAVAAEKNSGKFTVSEPVMVGDKELKPGTYSVEWSGEGSSVQVAVMKGHQTVANTTANVVTRDKVPSYNSVVLSPGNGNIKTLNEIDFDNRKEAIVFSQSSNSTPGQ